MLPLSIYIYTQIEHIIKKFNEGKLAAGLIKVKPYTVKVALVKCGRDQDSRNMQKYHTF